ncbi:MAG: hypothetical protein COB30_000080 [Ectothiorhodospiraceae bacterium]|nr:hypothetical protein [Ectothiorhodospiraceae bacterium]
MATPHQAFDLANTQFRQLQDNIHLTNLFAYRHLEHHHFVSETPTRTYRPLSMSFDSPNDGRLLSTLLKFNRKTVTVVTNNGQKWNISPHLLSQIKDTKPAPSFVYAGKEKQIK